MSLIKMNPKCACAQIQPVSAQERVKRSLPVDSGSGKNVTVDFGVLPVFQKRSKDIVVNLDDESTNYFEIVRPDRFTNCGAFSITPSYGKIAEGCKEVKLKCRYRPITPFLKSVDVFEFKCYNFNVIINTRGESKGPIVTVSQRHIYFFQTPKSKKDRQVFELRNTTNIPTEFMFDIDTKQKLFMVTPLKGIITKELYVKVTFNPKTFGVYSQQLNCLIFGNEPIMVYLVGIYSDEKIDPDKVSYVYYPFLFEETVLYGAYFKEFMQETEKDRTHSPVALNIHYLDLGRVVQDENVSVADEKFNCGSMKLEPIDAVNERKLNFSSKNFSVSNNLKQVITVRWIEDDKIFTIFPREAEILPENCMFFKCVFTPPDNEAVYFRTFSAQVYWTCDNVNCDDTTKKTVIVPLTISINVQGHSFPKHQAPLTNIELRPDRLFFPPCLVNLATFENFTLINRGTRPVIFKLVAPQNSCRI